MIRRCCFRVVFVSINVGSWRVTNHVSSLILLIKVTFFVEIFFPILLLLSLSILFFYLTPFLSFCFLTVLAVELDKYSNLS